MKLQSKKRKTGHFKMEAIIQSIGFTTIVILIATFLLLVQLIRRRRNQQASAFTNLPPGPKGWPYFGSLPTFIRKMAFQGKPMQVVFDDFAKEYGPVYCLNVWGIRVVVANTAETIKEILHDPHMNNRPAPNAVKLYQGTGRQ